MAGVDSTDWATRGSAVFADTRCLGLNQTLVSGRLGQQVSIDREHSDEDQSYYERQEDRTTQHLAFDDYDFVDYATKNRAHHNRDCAPACDANQALNVLLTFLDLFVQCPDWELLGQRLNGFLEPEATRSAEALLG
jgi:hypothetical protein